MQYQRDNKDTKRKCYLQPSHMIIKYKQVIIMHAKIKGHKLNMYALNQMYQDND